MPLGPCGGRGRLCCILKKRQRSQPEWNLSTELGRKGGRPLVQSAFMRSAGHASRAGLSVWTDTWFCYAFAETLASAQKKREAMNRKAGRVIGLVLPPLSPPPPPPLPPCVSPPTPRAPLPCNTAIGDEQRCFLKSTHTNTMNFQIKSLRSFCPCYLTLM